MNLSPVIQQCVFQNHALRQKEREARARLIHHEQPELFTEFSVVALFRLFHHGDISFQLVLLCKCRRIQSCQHLVVLVASPVSACKAHYLKCLAHILCAHQVRACAQIHKFSLAVKADFLAFRQILYQLYFIGLIFFLHQCDSIFSGLCKALNLQILFDDFFHLCFYLFKIVACQRSLKLHIIIKTVCNRRTNCQLCRRIKTFYRLCHHMAGSMAQRRKSFCISRRQNINGCILFYNGTQVNDLPVHFSGTCHSCQTFAQVLCNVYHGHRLCVFLYGTVF